MPKDTTRTVTVRQWRAQPMPDFKEIHRRREQHMARCKLQSAASRLKTPSSSSSQSFGNSSKRSANSNRQKEPTRMDIPSIDFEFRCDENSLKSILNNVGITQQATMSVQSSQAPTETATSHYLKPSFVQNANSTPLRVHLVNDRSSIYYNVVTTGGRFESAAHAVSSTKKARRVPAKSEYLPATNQKQVALSRFDRHITTTGGIAVTTPLVDEGSAELSVKTKSAGVSASKARRSRSASRPSKTNLLNAVNSTGKSSTPRCETRSASRSRMEANMARAIHFDEPERSVHQFTRDKAAMPGTGLRKHPMIELCQQSPSKAFYHDIDSADSQPSPISPWRHHGMLPGANDGSKGRSPLSIIDRNSIGRSGSTFGKKPRDKYTLATAKEAVAELLVQKKWLDKENTSAAQVHHIADDLTHKPDFQPIVCANQEAQSSSTLCAQEAEPEIGYSLTVPEIQFIGAEDEEENKENASGSEEISENNSRKNRKNFQEAIQQLELKARHLRRRSQLTTDVGEFERLTKQLEIVRRRQRELEEMCCEITAKLDNICNVQSKQTAAPATKPRFAQIPEDSEQPLNLKISLNMDEPLNLKIGSSLATLQSTNKDVKNRTILADITDKIVGSLTEEEGGYFEVPDSPTCDKLTFGSCAEISSLGASSPLDLCTVKKSCSEPALATVKDSPSKGLHCYIESLNLSTISEATVSPSNGAKFSTVELPTSSPVSARNSPVASGSPADAESPNVSSEFVGYRSYRPLLEGENWSRCGDPVALELALIEDDHAENKQHFVPISLDQSDVFDKD